MKTKKMNYNSLFKINEKKLKHLILLVLRNSLCKIKLPLSLRKPIAFT